MRILVSGTRKSSRRQRWWSITMSVVATSCAPGRMEYGIESKVNVLVSEYLRRVFIEFF